MITAICGDCGEVFVAAYILGAIECPDCGRRNTYCAVFDEGRVTQGPPLDTKESA